MDTETEANLAPEVVDIPSVESTAPELEADATGGDDANAAQTEQDDLDKLTGLGAPEGQPEEVEVEFEGMKFKVPKGAEGGFLMQSDYTKKTMELAELRKAAEAEKTQIEQFRNLTGERFQAVQNVAMLRHQAEQIKAIPVDGLSETDIIRFRQDLQDIEGQIAQWENRGLQAAQKEEQARSQQFAKVREAALSEAEKRIPNFTASRRAELEAFAIAHGSNPEDVQTIADPTIYEILHLADIGKKFMERQKKALTIKAAEGAKPAQEVGGKTSTGKDPSSMSPSEMAKFLGY